MLLEAIRQVVAGFPALSLQIPWSIANRQCSCGSGEEFFCCGIFFPAGFRAQAIYGESL